MHKLKVRDVMKLPQCHTAGESRGYAPNLQCMTIYVHLTCCHRTRQRFLIQNELKYFRREFILSFYIYYDYCWPGMSLGTGDTAANATEKDSAELMIIFLWTDEKMRSPSVYQVYTTELFT